MADILSDGTISWLGGMDTSRNPAEIGNIQYSKACNVVIPDSLGGIRSRFGIHCATLKFENGNTKTIYETKGVQGEGYYQESGKSYLICVVGGYVLKFSRIAGNSFYVENLNSNSKNRNTLCHAWVITIPNGCIVNNGFDYPIIIEHGVARRSNPDKGEIGIGKMGVYVQNRLFYVDQSGRRILASDFLKPTKFTREDTNIYGFACPDANERITAIGKQKSILGTVEGGNLIWSSDKDIYSADVRGTRSEWANLGSRVGKVTETVPGFAAASSYSFESFNTNIYFRSKKFGLSDLRQSEYQFTSLDATSDQSVEASYYLNNDTDWMLDKCYTRACNKRLYTTVAPERTDKGFVYWNGILSYCPAVSRQNQGSMPSRFESVFTGVRPWCLTTVPFNGGESLYIHSYDKDGRTRLYVIDESSDHDIGPSGETVEINGYIETKAYTLSNPLLLKLANSRFYSLNETSRSIKIKLFSRPESSGRWTETWNIEHKIERTLIEGNSFVPVSHQGQTRAFVNVSSEKEWPCYPLGQKFIALQYRIDFTGPLNLNSFVVTGTISEFDKTIKSTEQPSRSIYDALPDYNYSIAK